MIFYVFCLVLLSTWWRAPPTLYVKMPTIDDRLTMLTVQRDRHRRNNGMTAVGISLAGSVDYRYSRAPIILFINSADP